MSSASFPPAGGTGMLRVATERECVWTARSEAPWITLTSPANGQGDGDVSFTVSANSSPSSRTAAVVVGEIRREVTQQGRPCEFQLSSVSETVPASGGEFTIAVTASSAECGWTAAADSPWLTIVDGSEGRGNGNVRVRAAPSSAPQRTGALTIAGTRVEVDQGPAVPGPGCTLTVNPMVIQVGSTGAERQVTVEASAPACAWSAIPEAPWIVIEGGEHRSGSGTFTVRVLPSGGPTRRAGIQVGPHVIGVFQGTGCAVSVASADLQVPAAGGAHAVAVTATSADCGWTAASNVPWITISGPSTRGGSGQLGFTVAAHSGPARTGTLTVAGHTVRVTQASGCTFTIAPASHDAGSAAGGTSVAVSGVAGCAWTAERVSDWLTVSPASGTGSGTVSVSWPANMSPDRTGTVRIAGHPFTVNQPSACTFTFVPPLHLYSSSGGNGAVLVIVLGPCTWTAESTVDWIRVTSGASGTGDGVVQFVVSANPGPARTGILMIAGRRYTVTQQ